jgi:hypothetical protein
MDHLPALYPEQLHVLLALRPARFELVNALITRLACAGPLLVLDGGNCFQAHRLARLLRRHTPHLQAALSNIHVARAFTCYQVVALLAETPALPVPTLVLDLLSTFHDESVPLHERRRLLESSLLELRRLSSRAPTLVSAAPAIAPEAGDLRSENSSRFSSIGTEGSLEGAAELLNLLEEAADQLWRLEPPPIPQPLRLF